MGSPARRLSECYRVNSRLQCPPMRFTYDLHTIYMRSTYDLHAELPDQDSGSGQPGEEHSLQMNSLLGWPYKKVMMMISNRKNNSSKTTIATKRLLEASRPVLLPVSCDRGFRWRQRCYMSMVTGASRSPKSVQRSSPGTVPPGRPFGPYTSPVRPRLPTSRRCHLRDGENRLVIGT